MNIFQLDLSSPHLIEASAGTGKTWHLVALYLRLIAEGFGIDQVLAVTFTEAAAAELKDRIRSRLRQTFMNLTSGEPDPDVQPFLAVCDAALLRKRFLRAIVMIDEAQILTIHGFCHAVLRQYAFETGMPFDATLSADPRSIAEEITADWWARTVYPGPAWIAAGLAAGEDTLETWADLLRKAAARPDLVLLPEDNPSVQTAADLDSRYRSLRAMWLAEKETIFSLLQRNAGGLKANQYPPKKFPVWMSEISAFLEPAAPMMLNPPEGLIRLSASKLQAATRKGASLPAHAFFDLAEQWIETCSACAGVLVQMKREFLQSAIGEWDLRKRKYRVIGFDDLILNLYRSIQGPSGPELVRTLRNRFPAALIDEFQDTDPYQYGIFHAIYPDSGHPFFMIGDPKQAIYGFRGADIFTYLDAVDSVSGDVCRLDTNYRSGAGLIDGINALFQNTAKPFVDDRIRYEAVRAGVQPGALFRLNGERAAPLRIRFIRRSADAELDRNGFLSLRWMRRNLPGLVAAQITEWLCPGGASIDGRPISCEDVAVLVRTNAQAFQMLDALAGHRVPGVLESTHSVWDAPQALWIWRLLRAVQEPGSAWRIGCALCSDLFGLDAAGLYGINRNEALAGFWMEMFRHWRSIWRRKGIFAMLDAVFASDIRRPEPIGFRRVAGLVGAERHITNLLHLAELLQQAERETRAGPSKLIQWMEARMNGADADGGRQESELRLESDEKAVRIVTVHKSKGLEYPIVICPYLWDSGGGKNASSGPLFYHDPEANHRLTLHLDPQEEQKRLNREEAFAESMRLLYVAITRARHACVVYTAGLKNMESNALGYLLHPGRPEAPSGFRDDDALVDDLLWFKARAPDAIDICPFDPVISAIPLQRPVPQVPDLALQPLPAAGIRRVWRITSFSGLTSTQDAPPKPWAERDMDGPDTPSAGAALSAAADESGEVALADFDAGVQAGLLIHAIFEQIDFTDPQGVETEARHQMSRFGFDPSRHLGRLCQSVRDVLVTPLDAALPDLRLGRIPKRDRLNELGFLFPAAYPGGAPIDAGRLAEAWASGCGEFPSLPKRYAALLQGLPFDAFRGYLKGFIDLVFRWQDRWYIVDYKSNFLGRYFEDYGPERLQEQMFSHHYLLQAVIYALALHRYLSSRLADYSFDRHIGAIYYLFVRGMSPEKGAQSGVYAMQPPKALIEALDSLFRAAGSR